MNTVKDIRNWLDEQTVQAARDSPCIHLWQETWIHSWPESECTGAICRSCGFRLMNSQWDLYKEKDNETDRT